nr:immunoglobulin heavy chain junction region [Mus musculus]
QLSSLTSEDTAI